MDWFRSVYCQIARKCGLLSHEFGFVSTPQHSTKLFAEHSGTIVKQPPTGSKEYSLRVGEIAGNPQHPRLGLLGDHTGHLYHARRQSDHNKR